MKSPLTLSRRQALSRVACGFGFLALAGMAAQAANRGAHPLAIRPGHHRPRAKRVIFLFMGGGVSHLDSFDYKPALYANDGRIWLVVPVCRKSVAGPCATPSVCIERTTQ